MLNVLADELVVDGVDNEPDAVGALLCAAAYEDGEKVQVSELVGAGVPVCAPVCVPEAERLGAREIDGARLGVLDGDAPAVSVVVGVGVLLAVKDGDTFGLGLLAIVYIAVEVVCSGAALARLKDVTVDGTTPHTMLPSGDGRYS